MKNTLRQEFVSAGWPGEGNRPGKLGALLLGLYDRPSGKLMYSGKVGTGFTEKSLAEMLARLRPLEQPESPFAVGKPPRGSVFVRPELVGEVEFTEMTRDGSPRHPSFKGLREDKAASDVVRETT